MSNTIDSIPYFPSIRGRESYDDEALSLSCSSPCSAEVTEGSKAAAVSAAKPASEEQSDNYVSNISTNNNDLVESLEEEEEEEYHYVEYASALPSDEVDSGAMTASKSSFGRMKQNLRIATTLGRKKQSAAELSQADSLMPQVREIESSTHNASLFVQTTVTSKRQSTNMSPYNTAIEEWRRECRTREKQEFFEMVQQCKHSKKFFYSFTLSEGGCDEASFNRIAWWQRKGQLAVFNSPRVHTGSSSDQDSDIDYSTQNQSSCDVDVVLGTLAPGTVVWGVEFVVVPEQKQDEKETLDYVFLRILSPLAGYVLYSQFSYAYLAPGMPIDYVDPSRWIWRISCLDGAFVREGLELSSKHITTLPFGKFVKVSQKIVNSMGLSRLRIEQHDQCWMNDDESRETPKSAVRRRRTPNTESSFIFHTPEDSSNAQNNLCRILGPRYLSSFDMIDPLATGLQRPLSSTLCLSPICAHGYAESIEGGWISEALNPLSGQRGFVAQPLPFPVPALYRVTFPEGAVIRSDIELSSVQLGISPYGSILKVVGRAFSEHPMDQCIDRLKLAGGAGWVSVRLNKPPPYNSLIVELVGIDEDFDTLNPGAYHLKEALESSFSNNLYSDDPSSVGRVSGQENIQPLHHEEENATAQTHTKDNTLVIEQSISRSIKVEQRVLTGKSSSSRRRHYSTKEVNEDKCLICLIEERSATIVHAGTGHIACCLTCARILKARGDKCPVCRLPIDSVIQQFWA